MAETWLTPGGLSLSETAVTTGYELLHGFYDDLPWDRIESVHGGVEGTVPSSPGSAFTEQHIPSDYATAGSYRRQATEDDDSLTIYSAPSSVSTVDRENHVSELAKDLFIKIITKVKHQNDIEVIVRVLPELLRAFALGIGDNKQTPWGLKTMAFVHQFRR